MNITPLIAAVAVPVPPVQDVTTDQAKEQKLAEAQIANKPSVVYFSPVIKIDRSTSTAIIQYRDKSTGEVTRQSPPTKSELKAYEAPAEKAPEASSADHDEAVHVKEDA